MAGEAPDPYPDLVGTYRTFGTLGPAYEILHASQDEHGQWILRIRVLKGGEELDYPYTMAVFDPAAR